MSKPKLIWLQWTNRRRKTTAHAINPQEDMTTGKRRCICGSLIPPRAVEYDGKAKQDPFCLKIIKDGPSKRRKSKAKKPEQNLEVRIGASMSALAKKAGAKLVSTNKRFAVISAARTKLQSIRDGFEARAGEQEVSERERESCKRAATAITKELQK